MSRVIDICHTCHVSHYTDEMREEYSKDESGMSPTGLTLTLTCRECDARLAAGPTFRLIDGGKA